jgi:hypothetical protein
MGLRPFISIPSNLREWSRFFEQVPVEPDAGSVDTATIQDHAVTLPKMAQISASAVLGNPAAATADVSAIAAVSDGHVLRRTGGVLGFGTIPEGTVDNLTTDLASKANITSLTIPSNTLLGNNTAGSAFPSGLTYAQVLALLGRPTAFKTADTTITSSTALTADPHLVVAVEVASYTFELFLCFYEVTSGAGGFKFDLTGTATVSSILWAMHGFNTAVTANAGATAANTAQSIATIATSSSAPSWARVTGMVSFSASGTFALEWAQNSSSANGTTLKAKSFLGVRKL